MIESKDNQSRLKAGPKLLHGAMAKITLVAAACQADEPGPSTYVAIEAVLEDGLKIICPLVTAAMVDEVIAGLTMCRNKVWPEGGT